MIKISAERVTGPHTPSLSPSTNLFIYLFSFSSLPLSTHFPLSFPSVLTCFCHLSRSRPFPETSKATTRVVRGSDCVTSAGVCVCVRARVRVGPDVRNMTTNPPKPGICQDERTNLHAYASFRGGSLEGRR